MSAATLAQPEIAEFAASVRAALSDLTPDELDDLTDGLEADLTERLADGDAAELGDPVAYAEELRTAAGLPRPAKAAGSSVLAGLRALPGLAGRELRAVALRHPAIAGVARFLVSIRPVWWIFRGVAFTWLLMNVFGPAPTLTMLFGAVAIVVSIQFGRGKWLPFAWMRGLLLVANIVLIIATPFVAGLVVTSLSNSYYSQSYAESYPVPSGTGLVENGAPVGNIFAYDAQGNPLTDVQLFDQDGKPLNLVGDPTTTNYSSGAEDGSVVVPNQSVTGRLGWNVYPLAQVAPGDIADDGTLKPSATPSPAVSPFGTAKPLATSPAPAATALPTPAP